MTNIMLPDYNHSILNIITSILNYYNVDNGHSSLKELNEILKNKYKNIVLIILDGMGKNIIDNASKDGLFSKNIITNVTSVYPSTTTAALTTYYSGKPPYETAWIAYTQYFKEYGRTLDMLSHKDSYSKEEYTDTKKRCF